MSAVFDTGAAVTVGHAAFVAAHRALFHQIGTSQGTDADGTPCVTPQSAMAEVRLLGSVFGPSAAVSVDLTAAIAGAERPFDMILGWPILSQRACTIDHAQRRGAPRR